MNMVFNTSYCYLKKKRKEYGVFQKFGLVLLIKKSFFLSFQKFSPNYLVLLFSWIFFSKFYSTPDIMCDPAPSHRYSGKFICVSVGGQDFKVNLPHVTSMIVQMGQPYAADFALKFCLHNFYYYFNLLYS